MNSVYLALTGESVGHLTVSSKAVKRYFSKRMKSCHSYRYGHIKRFYYSWGNLQMLKRIQKKTKECWAGILKEVCNWKQDWFYCIVCVCVSGGGERQLNLCWTTHFVMYLWPDSLDLGASKRQAHDHRRRCIAPNMWKGQCPILSSTSSLRMWPSL